MPNKSVSESIVSRGPPGGTLGSSSLTITPARNAALGFLRPGVAPGGAGLERDTYIVTAVSRRSPPPISPHREPLGPRDDRGNPGRRTWPPWGRGGIKRQALVRE